VITEFVDTYNAERKRLKRAATDQRVTCERRLGEIDRELNRVVDATAKGMPPEDFVAAPRNSRLSAVDPGHA
jgi:hypothetical protein